MNPKIIGFIPARGGSKGIPNKNLVVINNLPLIEYTLIACENSKLLQAVYVSSDSSDILNFCKNRTKIQTLKRPEYLSTDTSSIEGALLYHLENDIIIDENDLIVLLHPTTPLRTNNHIDEALKLFLESDRDSLISVSEPMEHPSDMIYWDAEKHNFLDNSISPGITQRQKFKKLYFINGAIYIFKKKTLLKFRNRFGTSSVPYVMKQSESIDIDSNDDLLIAELLLKYRGK